MYRVRFLILLCFLVLYTLAQDEDTTLTDDATSTTEIVTSIPEAVQQSNIIIPQVKIVGGEVVQDRKEFPYQASLRYVSQSYPFCGGTIVSLTYILTAAHCVVGDKGVVISKSSIFVVVGDLITTTPTQNTLSRDVLQIIVHEEYSIVTLKNDIALLKISSLGSFDAFVNKIELSSATPSEGTICVVSGWGTTSAGGSASSVLRSVEVPIASQASCKTTYENQVYDGMLCAGYAEGEKDACQGDSGGPLVCNDVLVGVVSWGYSCAQPEYSGIYTDVAMFRDWIATHKGDSTGVSEDPKNLLYNEYVVQSRTEFPYQASLRVASPNHHFCGATIIDSQHVVTAAHCVVDSINEEITPDSLTVTVGNLNIREEDDTTTYRSVLDIYVHENYIADSLENDIAVLKVSEFDEWTSSINMVELATSPPGEGSTCTVSGWGALTTTGNYSDVLLFGKIPVLSRTVCTNYYQDDMKEGMICAGNTNANKSSCEGDSGGPLICDNKLAGVFSWGYNCSRPGYPGIYTNVADYSSWIATQVQRASGSRKTASIWATIFILVYRLVY